MESAVYIPPTQTRRLPLDLIAYVEAQQRPRETFGEAARRLLMDDPRTPAAGNDRQEGDGARPA